MAANPDVQFQILALAHLIFSPSDLHQTWNNAFTSGDFTPVSNAMTNLGFTGVAIREAKNVFDGGLLTPDALNDISGRIALLPPYDGAGPHPNGAQATAMVGAARSIDKA
jgi:hypothetical protein